MQLYQLGNESALNELLRQNEGIIHKVVKSFYIKSNSIDIDDLFQEGSMGLIIAADKYDINNPKKAKFSTYAVNWIRQKVSRFLMQKNTNDEISFDKPIESDENICLGDIIANNENMEGNIVEMLYQSELQKDIENSMLKVNTLEERTILEFNYGLYNNIPLNIEQISEILHIEPKKILIKKYSALKKLRTRNCKLPITKYLDEMKLDKQERKYKSVETLLDNLNYADVWLDSEMRDRHSVQRYMQ